MGSSWFLSDMGNFYFSKTQTIAFQLAREKNEKKKSHLHLWVSARCVNVAATASMRGKFLGFGDRGAERGSKRRLSPTMMETRFKEWHVIKCSNEWWLFGPKAQFSRRSHGSPSQRCLRLRCPWLLPLCTGQLFCWWNTDVFFSLHFPCWMWLFTSSVCVQTTSFD